MARSSFMVGEARSVAGVRLDQGDRDYVYARVDPRQTRLSASRSSISCRALLSNTPISSTCSTLPP
jgi:hypothetical protein